VLLGERDVEVVAFPASTKLIVAAMNATMNLMMTNFIVQFGILNA